MANDLTVDDEISQNCEPIQLRVSDQVAMVRDAIHEFFRQRTLSASRRLSQLFRVGRTSLLIGVVFLTVAITLAGLVDRALGGSQMSALIRESMVIGGWVAMWRPLEIFLYDWWPILAERKLFDRLSVAPVRITSRNECSTVEKRQVRIWPSAVSRMREQAPQKGSVTGAMMPISPGAPSAKR